MNVDTIEKPGNFGPVEYIVQTGRYFFWNGLLFLGLLPRSHTQQDQERDQIAEFTEPAACCVCHNTSSSEELKTSDGMSIQSCENCGHLYTSPRIPEETWVNYLKSDTERSRAFTESRLKYGMALPSRAKLAAPWWYPQVTKERNQLINNLRDVIDGKFERLHDVGCGVGFTLLTAREQGLTVSGNELNGPAVDVMNEQFGLDVSKETLSECDLPAGELDAIVMRDYIEHSYHPDEDLATAFEMLRPGGCVYIETFHTDCEAFEEQGPDWPFLFWNHTNHFSPDHLTTLVKDVGFEIAVSDYNYDSALITMIGKKPNVTP